MLLKFRKKWLHEITEKINAYLLKLIIKFKLDEKFGLRAWGLILYGVLPSNLALLGILDPKIGPINGILPIFYIIIASFLPIFLIFIFIKDRHKEWYLTADFLIRRSLFTTIAILGLATFISGISGLIHDRYIIGLPHSLDEWNAIAESFLLAVASIVVSTAFFMTALTKKINLPGLPTVEFIEIMMKIRNNLRSIKNSDVWKKMSQSDIDDIVKYAKEIESDINKTKNLTGNIFIKNSFEQIYEDTINLITIMEDISNRENPLSKEILWRIYFDNNLTNDLLKRRNEEKFESIERYRILKLNN